MMTAVAESIKPDWHLNRELSMADVQTIVDLANQGHRAWRISALFKTSRRRIIEICRIEGVEVRP